MSENDYKEKIEIARKAVEGLKDENLKLKAFEKVLDDLLGNKLSNTEGTFGKKSKKSKKKPSIIIGVAKETEEPEEDIISKLSAEDFPQIHNLKSKLDLSLYLLKILREKYEIDGLISSQIAKILSEKFRIKANQFNIGMILSKSLKYLERDKVMTRGGIGYKYKIMKGGEDYLKNVLPKINTDENEEESAQES